MSVNPKYAKALPKLIDLLAANINGDEHISISDVTALIDLLLARPSSMQWNVLPTQGGINVDNPMGEKLEIYDLDAHVVATISFSRLVNLPAGIYLVTSNSQSRKVVVK